LALVLVEVMMAPTAAAAALEIEAGHVSGFWVLRNMQESLHVLFLALKPIYLIPGLKDNLK
jgi:hypothetical protein